MIPSELCDFHSVWLQPFFCTSSNRVFYLLFLFFSGHPFDTMKVRLQTQPAANPIYNGVFDCVAKTAKWEGLSGFYKGMMSPIAGQMFVRATIFLSYGQAVPYIKEWRNVSTMRPSDWFLAGSAAWVRDEMA
jgi:solute carrier family 25 carnitine/acylcarnitine transporter 20/29